MIVDILFSLINLLVFIFFSLYIFNKYFKNSIKDDFKKEKNILKQYEDDLEKINLEIDQINNKIDYEQSKWLSLKSNISLWASQVEKDKFKLEYDLDLNYKELLDKKRLIFNNIYLSYLKDRMEPYIEKELLSGLNHYFKDLDNHNMYVDRIIDFINNDD